jgi:hypothetical protein
MTTTTKLRVLLAILVIALLPLATAQSKVQDPGPIDPDGGIGGPCSISNCLTTCTGPTCVECCCWYQCPSGGTWVCKSGYCPGTSRSCGPC